MTNLSEDRKIDRKQRLQIPHQDILKQDPNDRQCNWQEVVLGFKDDGAVMVEANRCLQCPNAPCMKACPIHNDIPGALWEAEQGNFIAAADIFRLTSTMPGVCGRICPQERLCEGSCVVGATKKPPVSIGRLEAFVADRQRKTEGLPMPSMAPSTGHRVAVIGSGPAGLTVAELVARAGNKVVVFEEWPLPGGILRYGIPTFKMEKGILEDKLDLLEKMGIEFRCNTSLGKDITIDDLLGKGFDAVFMGQGAGVPSDLGTPGESLAGVYHSTDFLVRANLPPDELPDTMQAPITVGKHVVVIGGGDTSMDCVRSAIRLAKQDGITATVTCLSRLDESQLIGRAEERKHARDEGAQLDFHVVTTRFIGDEHGHVQAIECVNVQASEPDGNGLQTFSNVPGTERTIPADTIVISIGYRGDVKLADSAKLRHVRGIIQIDPATGATSRPGVFAGGDSAQGPKLVVTAIAQARTASAGIIDYLAKMSAPLAGAAR